MAIPATSIAWDAESIRVRCLAQAENEKQREYILFHSRRLAELMRFGQTLRLPVFGMAGKGSRHRSALYDRSVAGNPRARGNFGFVGMVRSFTYQNWYFGFSYRS